MNPDYTAVFARRLAMLNKIRANPSMVPELKLFYRDNIAQFIDDWGVTFDPRLISTGQPAVVPFVLFPRQREFIDFVIEQWKAGDDGLIEKSRDVGASWLCMAMSASLCLFNEGFSVGVGSRKEALVDTAGSPKTLFWKGREFVKRLPREFRGTWTEKDAPFMRINFPDTNSFIGGESGDGIGRGDRTAIYFLDEAAFVERPETIDASLSATTNCRIDMSSVNGMNHFGQKRHSGRVKVFPFSWKDDPRKDEAWYNKMCIKLAPEVVASEIDMDYMASVEGILIPAVWVRACIDAHSRLGIVPSGKRNVALDVADGGVDSNACIGSHGILISYIAQWSGKGADIFDTTERAFAGCDEFGSSTLTYDGDGLGAGVRGDARVINDKRTNKIIIKPFRASGSIENPNKEDVLGIKNIDYFANAKAQGWWALRTRVENTFRWVVEGTPCDPDEILSISSSCKDYRQLVMELSQPTYTTNSVGKIVINKAPDGMKSPNLGDAAMMLYSRATHKPMIISPNALERFRRRK